MSRRVTRNLGPFRGYVASKRRHRVPLNHLTADSFDYLIDPGEEKLLRRFGSIRLAQYFASGTSLTSQFESGPTYNNMFARQVINLRSDSLSDGLPTHCILYSNDETAGMLVWMSTNTFTVADCSMVAGTATLTTATANGFQDVVPGVLVQITGLTGTVQVVSINSTTSIVVSKESVAGITTQTATFGGTQHGLNRFIGTAFSGHYGSDDIIHPIIGVTNRLKAAADRAKALMGSRRCAEAGDYVYGGNCTSGHLPVRWNRQWNDRIGSGSGTSRYLWATNIPPLWMKVVDGTTVIGSGSPQFKADKVAFFSVIFKYRDGSYSQPFVPLDKTTAGDFFFGRHKVTTACDSLVITVPIGPSDVTERIILRTVFGTEAVPPALADEQGNSLLGICGVMRNNTETSFTLRDGNDAGLLFDPTIVRFDRISMPPTRFLWAGDGRMWGGYTRPQAAAILICQRISDGGYPSLGNQYTVAVTATALSFVVYDATNTPGGTLSLQFADHPTLQDLVTAINSNALSAVFGGGALYIAAQLAPGADPNAPSDELAATTGLDFGDIATTAVMKYGGNGYPAILTMGSTYLSGQQTHKRRIWLSEGNPGKAGPGPSLTVRNFREGPARWGYFVGGGSLIDGQVVCFRNAIGICRNIKDGKTGLDDDYRLEPLNESRGCISDASIVQGDGWVGYMTVDGYVVTDGTREVIISGDLYNPADRQRGLEASADTGSQFGGILAQAISNILLNGASNDGEKAAQYIAAWLEGSRLMLSVFYNPLTPATYFQNCPTFVYDFSQTASASGLQEVLRPDGTPWGWSCPLSFQQWATSSCMVGGVIDRPQVASGAGNAGANMRRIIGATSALSGGNNVGIIASLLDANALRNDEISILGSFTATAASGDPTLTSVVGTMTYIPTNAILLESGTARIVVGATINSLDTAAATITMSANAKSSGSVTFYVIGRKHLPKGFLPIDMCDTLDMKSLKWVRPFYHQQSTGLRVRVTNELDRTGFINLDLPVSAGSDPFQRSRLPMTQAVQGLSKGYEISVEETGTGTGDSEFWGLEAEVEILNSHR